MNPPFYEISEVTERALPSAIELAGGSVKPRGELIENAEFVEQYWSVIVDSAEVFCYSIVLEKSGRRLLVFGPKRKSPQSHLYEALMSAATQTGARRLEKL